MKFEVIIPYYNEAHRLEETLAALTKELEAGSFMQNGERKVRFWWVDDGSTDGSSDLLEKAVARKSLPSIEHRILRGETNQGKGSAMRRAISQLRDETAGQSLVAFWDSDGELHPQGLFQGFLLLESESADIVFGSRFSKRNAQVLNFRHYLGNKSLTLISNFFSNLNLSDVHCCARFMKSEILFQLPLRSSGFDFEAEFVALVGRIRSPKLRLLEIPVRYVPRTVNEGKKIGLSHVLPQIFRAIRCRYFQKPIRIEPHRLEKDATGNQLEWKHC